MGGPPQLLAQQRDPGPALTGRTFGGAARVPVPGPAPAAEAPSAASRLPDVRDAERTAPPEETPRTRPPSATPGGLPVRSPGRTMAEAERERRDPPPRPTGRPATASRDAGSSFGAFHRGRRSGAAGGAATPEPPASG
ncbi:hypothetical protein [Streptomyces sp. NPDC058985]|uniref:hypothetical protein n=1 Tax=Streptomyces sp. NPDC058985 TaxID=3346684 RepID=UPI0036C8DD13